MKIFVRAPDGIKKDDVEMDLNADEIIESLRKKIEAKTGFTCDKLQLNGKTLKEDGTLRSYKTEEGAVLFVQSQYHNQYLPMGVQPQMDQKRKADEAGLDNKSLELGPEAKRAATMAAAENITEAEVKWCGLRCAIYGEKGMRRQMEDEHVICPSLKDLVPSLAEERNFALFAIFDGHGGKQVAEFVKTYLAVELANAMANDEPKQGPLSDKRLKKITEATFQRIDARIATELAGVYDGCTACVVLANDEQMFCANLGDSMAYLARQKEDSEEDLHAIPLQQRQHKCWMMKEKERILRAGGAVENGRINGILEVSRAFGDITLKKFGVLCTPEYMKFAVDRTKDRFILLACDGFWNAWTAGEALDYAQSLVQNEVGRARLEGDDVDMKGVCKELVTNVIEEKKAQDNVSVLLIHFIDSESE
ncbi:unnamed protein product [Polarella glacialis]|uniref:protein-serine/threonine phosphatase n=1 Tax=Polarella glacialis TaxID=89957 RepID=A0A813FU31_POLGL|nr:unnamed protein product [Polarella glacialis]|eukprot:CAMPEP_0115085646 /NCGR_PEP_ID=MMETSP0227-20121206/22067_1 /TAXON_ID=89957 /ORGANISM="Polarella glacialis, Strain CCMP 1383" /LENGTH=420 /DNA_ID=CAMNT_0002474859 /DNA_START=51 /DNA_END=1313 /DNA_ORIENTATION=-